MSDRRKELIQTRAAEYLGVEVAELEDFFQNASTLFWRNFKFPGHSWGEVKDAFNQAKRERQSTPRPGISRKDGWLPLDCQKALEILVMFLPSQLRDASY